MSSFRRVSVEGTSSNISTVEDAIEDRIRYLRLEGSDLMPCLVDTGEWQVAVLASLGAGFVAVNEKICIACSSKAVWMGILDCQRHLLPSYPCVAAISCGPGVSKDLLTIAGQISVTIDERNLDSSIQCKAQIDQSFVANIVTEQGKGFYHCPAGWSEIERHTESSLDVKLVQKAIK
jgi:hypothetical protein